MNNIKIKQEQELPTNNLYSVWSQTLGDHWPISKSQFRKNIKDSRIYTARDADNNILAFLAFRIDNNKLAQLITVVVLPEYQDKGVGSELLLSLIKKLKENEIKEIKLGTGAGSYFWPGIPDNLPQAKNFFDSHEFSMNEEAVDMVQDISKFSNHPEILDRPIKNEVKITTLHEDFVNKLLSFEKDNFSEWYSYFQEKIEEKEVDDILIAIDSQKQIVGSMILLDNDDIKWNMCFDGLVGGFGALGVSKDARGQGIGLAMAVKATSILKERGFKYSFLGWTYLIDWYGKIGYKVWRTYTLGDKQL